MKNDSAHQYSQKGFTLLEIIITLVLVSILGAMLVQVMGSGMIQSSVPVTMAQDTFSLNQVMEKITADYRDGVALTQIKSDVESGNYGDYTVKTSAYIKFSGVNEIPDASGDNDMLKITISFNDQSLTVLFTE